MRTAKITTKVVKESNGIRVKVYRSGKLTGFSKFFPSNKLPVSPEARAIYWYNRYNQSQAK